MTHGTVSGYIYHKCKCQKCRKAWATYWGARVRRYRAAGLCRSCPLPSVGGGVFCERHRAKNAARKRDVVRPRGVCPRCKRDVAVGFLGTCHRHRAPDGSHCEDVMALMVSK